jgi:hypothetical protein
MKIKYHKTLSIVAGFGLVLFLALVYFPSTVLAGGRQVNPTGYHPPRVSDHHWGNHHFSPPPVRYRPVEFERFRPRYPHDWPYYHRPYHFRPIPFAHPYGDRDDHGRYHRTY